MKLKQNKLVCGVGTNDADYNVYQYGVVGGKRKAIWRCPYYERWVSMLKRCYCKITQARQPTYVGCYVIDAWHLFSNFKTWMETQDWEGKALDKDILFPCNKIYGPDTCVFVEARLNGFITEKSANQGEFPIGVSYNKYNENYVGQCWSVETGKQKYLGSFDTLDEAHQAWLAFKLKQAYILAEQQTDKRIADALVYRYENYSLA